MNCRVCGARLPENANFCANCGAPVARETSIRPARANWSLFWPTLLGSVALSLFLTLVLGWPVFILGAFLPVIGWTLRRR